MRPPKGTKEMWRMMGEEKTHNELTLGQFDIVAITGSMMKHKNFDVLRHSRGWRQAAVGRGEAVAEAGRQDPALPRHGRQRGDVDQVQAGGGQACGHQQEPHHLLIFGPEQYVRSIVNNISPYMIKDGLASLFTRTGFSTKSGSGSPDQNIEDNFSYLNI